ncbi:hypothetical protein [Streptomyces sp. NPDC057617]|uniref:hypothetical protein n=1 Tax=Streptomyces sp. NPDC057617 TaxID=3346184 RepID=UPI0036B9A1DB
MMPTADQAIANAARLLERAEIELTNLPLMGQLDSIASSWLQMAGLLMEKERD